MFDYNKSLFHVGVRVRKLQQAMDQLGDAFGLNWAPAVEREQSVWLPDRGVVTSTLRFAYSSEGPQHVELLQGEPGTPWFADDDERGVHHLGVWADDVAAETERFLAAGWSLEAAGAAPEDGYGIFTYVRSPLGVLLEPVSSARKDLFARWWAGQPMR